jgi:hypothetical protein
MAPLILPQDAVKVMFTGVDPADTLPILAPTESDVLPPEVNARFPAAKFTKLIVAPEKAKSVELLSVAPETVALPVNVAAPAEEPVADEIPTVAVPSETVNAVAEVNVADDVFKLKLTSLPTMGVPVPSRNSTLALYPLAPILVTGRPLESTTLESMVAPEEETTALVEEKSIVPVTVALETLEVAVNFAAPEGEPAVGAMLMDAIPVV